MVPIFRQRAYSAAVLPLRATAYKCASPGPAVLIAPGRLHLQLLLVPAPSLVGLSGIDVRLGGRSSLISQHSTI
jgi:hypothetical protein